MAEESVAGGSTLRNCPYTYDELGEADVKNECDDGADLSWSAVKTLFVIPWWSVS